jgi:hypothetical protein
MKTLLKIAAFYSLALILGGCVPSVHPLFTENEQISDANIVGIWYTTDSNDTWVFKPQEKGYEGIYIENNKNMSSFDVKIGKLGKYMFLDVYPQKANLADNDFYKSLLVYAHTFLKMELTKDSLKLSVMSPDSIDKLLKSDPNIIKHERVEDGKVVLTASTKELQDFMLKYGVDEKYELFGKAIEAGKVCHIKGDKSDKTNGKQPKSKKKK